LVQYIINEAWKNGLLSLPISEDFGQKYPILQYADETLFIMPADQIQMINLNNILTQ
jgi:hypothetical protein